MAPFCKVCFAAGKTEEEYTSHFVRSEPGPNGFVVCPHLLSLECRYCRQKGHTPKHCPKLGNKYVDPRPAPVRKMKTARVVDNDGWVTKTTAAPRIVFEKAVAAKPKSPVQNLFGVLSVEEDVPVVEKAAVVEKEVASTSGPQLQGIWACPPGDRKEMHAQQKAEVLGKTFMDGDAAPPPPAWNFGEVSRWSDGEEEEEEFLPTGKLACWEKEN